MNKQLQTNTNIVTSTSSFCNNRIFKELLTKCLILTSIYLFINGLLKTTDFPKEINTIKPSEISNKELKYKSLIYIVFDGLRYDYTVPNKINKKSIEDPFSKFNLMKNLYKIQKFHALSVSGIPTSTTARIFGLLTGTPSNYLEGIRTFMNSKIQIDNLVDQICRKYKKVSFYGDRTWIDFCPILNMFSNYTFDPYSKTDLVLNEKIAIDKLLDRIGIDDVIMGHFISLDAFGHLYGGSHKELQNSILRYDDFVKQVYDNMAEDTLLLLTSDHGVTDEGCHGGASRAEMSSFVSFISKKPLNLNKVPSATLKERDLFIRRTFDTLTDENCKTSFTNIIETEPVTTEVFAKTTSFNNSDEIPFIVHQDDILPTVSYLLDIPVPYCTYGNLIPELVDDPLFNETFLKNKLRLLKTPVECISHYNLSTLIHAEYTGTRSVFLLLYTLLICITILYNLSSFYSIFNYNNILLLFAIVMVSHSIRFIEYEEFIWIFIFLIYSINTKSLLWSLMYFYRNRLSVFMPLGIFYLFCIDKGKIENNEGLIGIFKTIRNKKQEISYSKSRYLKSIFKNLIHDFYFKDVLYIGFCFIKQMYPSSINNKEILGLFPQWNTLAMLIYPSSFSILLILVPYMNLNNSYTSIYPLLQILGGSKQLESIDYEVIYKFTSNPSTLQSGLLLTFYYVYPCTIFKKKSGHLYIALFSLICSFIVTWWEVDTMMFYFYFVSRCFFVTFYCIIQLFLY